MCKRNKKMKNFKIKLFLFKLIVLSRKSIIETLTPWLVYRISCFKNQLFLLDPKYQTRFLQQLTCPIKRRLHRKRNQCQPVGTIWPNRRELFTLLFSFTGQHACNGVCACMCFCVFVCVCVCLCMCLCVCLCVCVFMCTDLFLFHY